MAMLSSRTAMTLAFSARSHGFVSPMHSLEGEIMMLCAVFGIDVRFFAMVVVCAVAKELFLCQDHSRDDATAGLRVDVEGLAWGV